jgi:cytochrome c biogenesis factor
LYFYIWSLFIFIFQKFFSRGLFILFFIFLSHNYFTYFEHIGEVNNFFFFFNFKVINLISNINLNLIIIFILTWYLTWLNFNYKFVGWFFLFVFNEIFFYKITPYNPTTLDQVNLNLLNGLFLIHPIILILLLLTFFSLIWYYSKFFKDTLVSFYKLNYKFQFKSITLNLALLLSLMLLITGGWWAQQELNWGGWWAWDFVELANLNIFIFTILIKHSVKINHQKLYLYTLLSKFFILYIIIVVYIYTRYNLVPSVHSFLTDLSFLQYDYLVDSLLIISSLIYLYYLFLPNNTNYLKYCKTLTPLFLNTTYTCLFIINLVVLLCIFLYLSTKGLNLWYIKFSQNLLFFIIFYYFLFKYKFSTNSLYFILINPFLIFWSNLFLYSSIFWKTFRKSHILFFTIVLFIIFTNPFLDLLFINNLGLRGDVYLNIKIKFNNFFKYIIIIFFLVK